ncbi:MAG TPA: hypothetical protein VGA85_07230 [Dehalococcoidales bacterium]
MTERYYISVAPAADKEAIKTGFAWLIDQLQKSPKPLTGLLCVPTISNLRGIITEVIGESAANALAAGKAISVPNSSNKISLITSRKFNYGWQGGPILAAYPDKDILDKLDDMPGVTAILAVPWIMTHIQLWIDTWAPKNIRAPETSPIVNVKNPVVVEALKSLTRRVNLSAGITHPLDRQATIDLFELLNSAGEKFDPNEVRAWLIREGKWSPKDADQVKAVAESILKGARLRGRGRSWADDIVEQWRTGTKL